MSMEQGHETVKTFSRDQLILPKEPSPKALRLLKRAEEAGLGGMFESHWLSDVRLTKDTRVLGWNEKPNDWYWEQIMNGSLSNDAAQLPGAEILIDITSRPNYERSGVQLHKNDPLGHLMARLREEKRIQTIREYIPKTSRFWTPPDPELIQVVLPKIAELLGEDASEVRLPTEIEFNILGNFAYPHFGEADTWEWLNDKFADSSCLVGGGSLSGGLADVGFGDLSGGHGYDSIRTFRLLVVVSSKP